ncbi:TMhelix containing protein [Vibrio crassostreae]|nr:TMhelix containing protein [Vibrio crassostreae]
MISALLNLVTSGVATYKQLNQNKAEALKRKDELENEKHQARVRRLQNGEEQASSLDDISIRNRGFKDEFILLVVFVPLILSFIPNYAPYVEQGFNALQNIPNPYWFVVGAVVVDTLGMRAMVRYLLEYYASRWKTK